MSVEAATAWMVLLFARATVILLLGVIVVALLRRSSSSARHVALGLTVAALLILPLLSSALPSWEVAVLPAVRPTARASAVRPLSSEPGLRTEGAAAGQTDTGPAAGAPAPRSPNGHVAPAARSSSTVTAAGPREGLVPLAVRDEHAKGEGPFLPSRGGSVLVWLTLAWAVGAAIGLLQLGRSSLLARRTRQGAEELADPGWTGEVEHASRTLGLRRRVRLMMSDAVRVPVVHGFRQPAIVLPTSAEQWPKDRCSRVPAPRAGARATSGLAHPDVRSPGARSLLAPSARVVGGAAPACRSRARIR